MQNRLFADIPAEFLRETLQFFSKTRMYPSYELIVQEGKSDRELYLLEEGSAVIKVSGKVVGELSVDDIFGEVGFCASGKRSASVFAGKDGATTRIISPAQFAEFGVKRPRLAFIMSQNLAFLLASKLQKTNQSLRSNIGQVEELKEELDRQQQQEEQRSTSLLGRLFSSLSST